MDMDIGTNAGIVWRALDKNGQMTLEELMTATNLSLFDTAAAIGWLSRENKIWTAQDENDVNVYSIYRDFYF